MSVKLKSGDVAPDFILMGDDGKEYSLKSFKKLVLYFYPKDNTPGCTKEAVGFSELIDKFSSENIAVIGISPDSIATHKKFREKHNLKIILLSDPDKKVAEAYGAYGEKTMYGKKTMGIIRSTFIIEEGVIIDAFYNVKVDGHCEMVYNRSR
ncbi:MAG: peroxiredoxin [Calditerrivibrio sp.]|nr:peroxiredoxin [Calditerrivibrio sp.]MCA1932988.1 peroxiredoxin [Calditerrivibrio sp.]MCA1980823.1 peroxiredoxin [Calditerrivibrio sp.]